MARPVYTEPPMPVDCVRTAHTHCCLRALARQALLPLLVGGMVLPGCVLAQPAPDPAASQPSVYAQMAGAENHTRSVSAGLTLPWSPAWRWNWGNSPVDGYWDVGIGRWQADAPTGLRGITVLGFVPTFRLHPDGHASAWFIDAGIGVTWASDVWATNLKRFSTRFNFASQVGVGLQLGAQRSHEVALRIQHVSNGGYRSPNPGENFVQLRYAARF